MSYFSKLRDLCLSLIRALTDFLFPRNPKIIVLESLTSGEIIKTLPEANGPDDDNIIALFDYTHPVVKEIVWEIKYNGNVILAKRIGEILFDTIIQELEERNLLNRWRPIILMPMPISDKRRFERGWNQAELLTREIKKIDVNMDFKYLPHQLTKVVHTESQTKTGSKRERERNLQHSMKILNPQSVEGRFVVLVDDVVTTGSTLSEAKRVLKEAGAKKILCVTIAH